MERSVSRVPGHEGKRIGAGYARFGGDGSPLTQSYGLAHNGAPCDLNQLEAFYQGRATNWELIITPFDHPDFLGQATKFGYIPHHFESVMVMTVPPIHPAPANEIAVEEVVDEFDLWTRTCEAGWLGLEELPHTLSPLGELIGSDPTQRRFLATIDATPAGTAALLEYGGDYLMAGASTRPQFRGQGVQKALTHRRLATAGEGALIQVVTVPGSESHRNAQRMGFEVLYSKLVLMRREE